MAEQHPEIARATKEPQDVRAWALANATAMVLVDDPAMDEIFSLLTRTQRVSLGLAVARAALQALEAIKE